MEIIFPWIEQFANNSILFFLTIFLVSLINMFFPPIPLETLTVFGSYAAGAGYGSPIVIWLATVAGMSVGGIIMYRLAFIKGGALLNLSWLKNHLNPQSIDKTKVWFQRYGIWTIYIGKCVTGMSLIVVFCCGLFKVEQRRAMIAIIGSNVLYYGTLVLFGRYLGRKWQTMPLLGSKVATGVGVLFLAIMICGIIYFYWSNRKVKKTEPK